MIVTFNFLFRVVTLLIFFLWWCYWAITAKEADLQKPFSVSVKRISGRFIRRWFTPVLEAVLVLQLFGLQLFPLPDKLFILQMVGFVLVLGGVSISILARRTLGANWTHAYDYQIKKEHILITNGMYAYVRHPIYTGLYVALVGGELVAQSYLGLLFPLLFIGGYWQARQEETILANHFGKEYLFYMKHTKMFLPYLW